MNNNKNKISRILLSGAFLSLGLYASSSVDRNLEDCRGDNTCMSKVLAALIERNQNGGGGGNETYIEFYHDDGRCETSNLIRRVRFGISPAACQQAAQTVTQRVWGVRMNGQCQDISDTDFADACIRMASAEKALLQNQKIEK